MLDRDGVPAGMPVELLLLPQPGAHRPASRGRVLVERRARPALRPDRGCSTGSCSPAESRRCSAPCCPRWTSCARSASASGCTPGAPIRSSRAGAPARRWVGARHQGAPGRVRRRHGRPHSAENAWRSLELVLGNRLLRAGSLTARSTSRCARPCTPPRSTTAGSASSAVAWRTRASTAGRCSGSARRERAARSPGLSRWMPKASALTLADLPTDRFASLVVR